MVMYEFGVAQGKTSKLIAYLIKNTKKVFSSRPLGLPNLLKKMNKMIS